MANDAGGVVRPMGLLYPCQRGNTGQPGMSAFQVNGSPRAYIASSLRERTSTVHPHACGEHFGYAGSSQITCGSSPRMWGTRPAVRAVVERERFIPTHVGNTGCPGARPGVPPVHPHARGEHTAETTAARRKIGSSPRTWGTLSRLPGYKVRRRFIPTHVGNTSRDDSETWLTPVHPHARGEHPGAIPMRRATSGSSPRTWGTLFDGPPERNEPRFIPTHVGNTRRWQQVRPW